MSIPEEDQHLPPRFRRASDGALEHQARDGDEESWRWICGPLFVVAFVRDEHSENWALLIEAADLEGARKRFVPPRSACAGAPSVVSTWRSTDNALETVCAAASGTILILDELGQLDPRKAGEAAYMIANGRAKARANAGGDARRRATWLTTLLSIGEIPLADKVVGGGGRARRPRRLWNSRSCGAALAAAASPVRPSRRFNRSANSSPATSRAGFSRSERAGRIRTGGAATAPVSATRTMSSSSETSGERRSSRASTRAKPPATWPKPAP